MRAHAVVDTARPQPGLRDREAAALFAEQVRDRHPDVVVDDLAVAVLVLPAEHRHRPQHRHSRGVDRHQDHRLLLMAGGVGVGAAHHDQDLAARIRRTRGPPLAAVDDVVAAVAQHRRLDVAGVAGGHRGLGHRERAADLAVQQWLEPLLALLLGGEQVQGLHVAGVGRRAVDRLGRDLQCSSRSARPAARTPGWSAPTRTAGTGSTARASLASSFSSSMTGGTVWSSGPASCRYSS